MAGGWRIRPATAADAAAIARVHERAIRGRGLSHYTAEEVESWATGLDAGYYARLFARAKLVEVAVNEDGAVVAFGAARDDEVAFLYTDPDWTGQGIGSALLARAEDDIRARGHAALRVESSLAAELFYAHRGYVRRRIHGNRTGGGKVLAVVTMIKPA